MLAFDDVPSPHPATTLALLGLALLLWLFARVQLLRRQLARGAGEGAGVTRLRFLHRLAAWRGTDLLLGVVALGCVMLLAWSLR